MAKKAAQKPSSKNWYLWGIGFLLLVCIVGFWKFKKYTVPSSSSVPSNSASQTKTFRSSDVMDFTIEIPEGFEVEESMGSVVIKNLSGQIEISFIGSFYTNLDDHLSDSRNNLLKKLTDTEKMTINQLEVRKGFLGKEKNYFIYAQTRVYFLFTNAPVLYPVLDSIVNSFQYTPNE